MRLKKWIMIAAISAAFAGTAVFSATAAVDEESVQVGWIQQGNNWYFYDASGNRKTGWVKAEEGDGRGHDVWFYLDSNGVMVHSRTMNIDGREYTFNEDGSYVDEQAYGGANRGSFNVSTFTNGWSNIKLTFPSLSYSMSAEDLQGMENEFSGKEYAPIGTPKLTYDFFVEVNSSGDMLELYYADMSAKPSMTPTEYLQALAGILDKTDYYTIKANPSSVAVGGQDYTKITLVNNDVDKQKDIYCRKQDQFMVVLSSTAETDGIGNMNSIISSITTAR